MNTSVLLALSAGAVGASFFSALSGMGGGVILFALLNLFFVPQVALALHAFSQIFSNGARVVVFYKYVKWKLFLPYFFGSTIGVFCASYLFFFMPERFLQIIIALFLISYALFQKQISANPLVKFAKADRSFFVFGICAGLLSMTLGAVGPFLAPFLKENIEDKETFISTKAMLQLWVQILKSILFVTVFSFDFKIYYVELIFIAIGLILGTLLGKKIHEHIPEKLFSIVLRVTLFFIGTQMLYEIVFKK